MNWPNPIWRYLALSATCRGFVCHGHASHLWHGDKCILLRIITDPLHLDLRGICTVVARHIKKTLGATFAFGRAKDVDGLFLVPPDCVFLSVKLLVHERANESWPAINLPVVDECSRLKMLVFFGKSRELHCRNHPEEVKQQVVKDRKSPGRLE